MSKQVILVIGATGAQGGSVVQHLLKTNKWQVRALTRNVESDKAKELKSQGVEVVKGDLNNKEELTAAMKGAYGLFAVTNYWENPSHPEVEQNQGHLIADVAKDVGVKHVVFSSLEDAEKMSGGRYQVAHFDGKARIADYMKSIHLPLTEVLAAFYAENFLTHFAPKKSSEGNFYEFSMPQDNAPLDILAIEDLGGVVAPIFEHPEEWIGKSIGVAGDALTPNEIAAVLSKVHGKDVRYKAIPVEVWKKFPYPAAEEMANMFQLYIDFAGKIRDVKKCRELYPQIQTFEQFAKKIKIE